MYKVKPAILYTNELKQIFLESFYKKEDEGFHCSNWIEYDWVPSKDNHTDKEYVIVDDFDNIVVFFSWSSYYSNKKTCNTKLLKVNKTIVLPIAIILEQLYRDMICIRSDIFCFASLDGSYSDAIYKKLCKKGIVKYTGFVKNGCLLSDGEIYNLNNYYMELEDVKTLLKKYKRTEVGND